MERLKIHFLFYYEFKLGNSAAEAARNINKAFGEETTSERTVQHWFKKFRSGDVSLSEKKGRGRPSIVNKNQLKAIVEQNPKTTVRELASELGVNFSTISRHLENLGKVKKLEKWVPQESIDKN